MISTEQRAMMGPVPPNSPDAALRATAAAEPTEHRSTHHAEQGSPARDAAHAPNTVTRDYTRRWLRNALWILTIVSAAIGAVLWWQDRPRRLIRRAELSGAWATASSAALQYLATHPDDAAVQRSAARSLVRQGRFVEAEAMFERAGRLDADDLRLRAGALVALERRTAAAAILEELRSRSPADPTTIRQLALVKHSIGQTDEAIRLARELREFPEFTALGWCTEAVFWDDFGQPERAVECLEHAIATSQGSDRIGSLPIDRVYTLLGRNLLKLGQPRRACDALRQAVSMDETPAAYWYLGQCELDSGDPAAAERCWKRTLELDSKHAAALSSLGQLALRESDPHEAIRWLTLALAQQSESVTIHSSLARAYARIDRDDLRAEHQQKADTLKEKQEQERLEELLLRQSPDSPAARRLRADRALKEGKLGEARDLMEELVRP